MTSIKVKECSSCGQGFDEDNNSIGKPIPTKKCTGGIHDGPIVLCTIISPGNIYIKKWPNTTVCIIIIIIIILYIFMFFFSIAKNNTTIYTIAVFYLPSFDDSIFVMLN